MFTSRFHCLGLESSCRKIHQLRPFSDDESWQLLQEKIFQIKCCPPELVDVGTQIAKNCNGLPLAVVVVAGILARIEKNRHQWREVANNQSSYIADDHNKQSIKVIELSYNHLPDYLKSCFIYIGALFAHRSISVRKLICSLVAEGFVLKAEGKKSLEDVAVDHLTDLISRSLIIVAKRRSTGDIKECHVHDLISDFCLEKAKEDRFFEQIERFPASNLSREIIFEERRICSHRPDDFLVPEAYGPLVRTLFFRPSSLCLKNANDVSSFCHKFKLLKVLDLENIWIWDTFPEGIASLTRLSYLLICGYFDSIPPSIAKLWNLETFIVKGSTSLVCLPDTLWNMINLRHLHVSERALLSRPSNGCARRLDNLQAVSTLFISSGDDTEELLKGFVNVKSLSVYFDPWDYFENRCQLPGLATLNQLESLRLCYEGNALRQYKFSFPSNIRKLTLSKFHFPWKKISLIGKLPNIEVLKLLYGGFEGEEWEMGDGEFPKLKFLKLKNLDIRKWSVSSDDDHQFPPLQQLVLQSCPLLEEVPPCLGDIPTLDMIEVSWCTESLKEVVKQIQEEQLDMGNLELKVFIK